MICGEGVKSGRGAVYERGRGSRWKGPPLNRSSPLGMPSRQLAGTLSALRSPVRSPKPMKCDGASILGAVPARKAVRGCPRRCASYGVVLGGCVGAWHAQCGALAAFATLGQGSGPTCQSTRTHAAANGTYCPRAGDASSSYVYLPEIHGALPLQKCGLSPHKPAALRPVLATERREHDAGLSQRPGKAVHQHERRGRNVWGCPRPFYC